MNKTEQSKIKRSFKLKYAFWILFLLSVLIIGTLSSLYVVEIKRRIETPALIQPQTKLEGSKPCFDRAVPIKITNIALEPEVANTTFMATTNLFKVCRSHGYHASSIRVSYMGEEIWNFNCGSMNYTVPHSARPNKHTPYPIASISKVFNVIMLERFVDLGLIRSVDDEVSKYQPAFKINNPFSDDKITFRQLSCMMSGLPREAPCYPISNQNFCPRNTTEMFKRLTNVSLILPPGVAPSYSNLASALLGRVLERQLKNETIETWMQQNILKPLNMTNTGYNPVEREKTFPVSSGTKTLIAPVYDWGWLRPAGGMYSSAHDLGKLGDMLLHNSKNQILHKETKKRLLSLAYIYPDGTGQACPFEVNSLDPYQRKKLRLAYMIYSKDGATLAYGAKMLLIPQLQLNINILAAQKFARTDFILKEVALPFIKAIDQLLKRKGEKYRLPPNPEYFVGTYKLATYWPFITHACNISLENGMLYIRLEWMTATLNFVSDYVLETRDFNKDISEYRCFNKASGVLRNRYIFQAPNNGEKKCPGFHINGISAFGYVKFKRLT